MDFNIDLSQDFDIYIGPHLFHVKFVPRNDSSLDDNYGTYHSPTLTIRIAKDVPYSLKLSTLFHELLHVLEDLYDIKISHKDLNLVGDLLAQVLLMNFKVEKKKKD